MSTYHLIIFTVSILLYHHIIFLNLANYEPSHFALYNRHNGLLKQLIMSQFVLFPFCFMAFYLYKVLIFFDVTYLFILTFTILGLIIVQISEFIYKRLSFIFMLNKKKYISFLTTTSIQMGFLALFIINEPSFKSLIVYNFTVCFLYFIAVNTLRYVKPILENLDIPTGLRGIPIELLTVSILSFTLLGIF